MSQTKIAISQLSRNINKGHVDEIFSNYGKVHLSFCIFELISNCFSLNCYILFKGSESSMGNFPLSNMTIPVQMFKPFLKSGQNVYFDF